MNWEKLKRVWARWPRMSRGQKTIRNFLGIALMLTLFWGLSGYPLPTAEMEFRRQERISLLEPARYQGAVVTEDYQETWRVGTTEDQVRFLGVWPQFEEWPRAGEGATLCPVPLFSSTGEEAWIAAVDLPQGTAETTLEVTVSCWTAPEDYGGRYSAASPEAPVWEKNAIEPVFWTKTYRIAGRIQKEGAAFYPLHPSNTDPNSLEYWNVEWISDWDTYRTEPEARYINCRMEAVFYDQYRNHVLGRARLSTPD